MRLVAFQVRAVYKLTNIFRLTEFISELVHVLILITFLLVNAIVDVEAAGVREHVLQSVIVRRHVQYSFTLLIGYFKLFDFRDLAQDDLEALSERVAMVVVQRLLHWRHAIFEHAR